MPVPEPASLSLLTPVVCCSSEVPPPVSHLHLSLNVRDLARAVEFYRILFGVRPARQEADYVKFELARPPVIFSLTPMAPGDATPLRHLAFPVHQPSEVAAIGRRLSIAGLSVVWERAEPYDDALQEAVVCRDPDGNCWRIVCRVSDLSQVAADTTTTTPTTSVPTPIPTPVPVAAPSVSWEHRILTPVDGPIPQPDGSVDVVRLEGTFNADLTDQQRGFLLQEARRVLKPGGQVQIHGLVADRELVECPTLPGVAAVVRWVPSLEQLLNEIRTAGFIDLQMTRYPEKSAFRGPGYALRELKLSAWQPLLDTDSQAPRETSTATRRVMYRGPWSTCRMDDDRCFRRGEVVHIPAAVWERLQQPPWRGMFLDLDQPPVARPAPECEIDSHESASSREDER